MGVRRELDRALTDVYRRLDNLEKWQRDHDKEHEDDDDDEREGRRWTVTQIVALFAAAATVGGFWLNAVGR